MEEEQLGQEPFQEDNPLFDINLDEVQTNQQEQEKLLKELIENQNKLIEHFVPSAEEVKKQQQEEKKQLEEEKKIQEQLEIEEEELQKQIEQEKQQQEEYNQQVLEQLTLLNKNITGVEFQNQNTNSYLYLICFGFLFAFVISFIYKLIKRFI